MSSQSLQDAVARNSNWINSVITNSKLASQLSELLSIDSLNQKINIQEGELDAKFVNAKTLRGYKGTWAADTNTPALSNSSGVVGDIYKVSVGGTIDIGSGSITYVVGDLIYLSEDNWIKISPNQISDIIGLTNILDDTVRKTGAQTITGDKTFSGDAFAITKPNATNNTTVATTAFVRNLIGEIPAGLAFEGTWNADTNTPDLSTETLSNGKFWIVSVSGATNLGGITDWKVGDWAIYVTDGAGTDGWQKVDNSSVLDGQGTGQTVALWSGSGDTNTLTNSPITVSGDDVTFAGNVSLPDDGKAIFGDSNDLEIYHDGVNNNIKGVGGNLEIAANNILLKTNDDSETMAQFIRGGAVKLFFDDAQKFETTTTGVTVTGDISAVGGSFTGLVTMTDRLDLNDASYNVWIGKDSGISNTNGSINTASGYKSLENNTTGSSNIASGNQSLYSNTTGNNNVALGVKAGKSIDDGSSPTDGSATNITGSNSIFIGTNTRANADGETNQIVIGDSAIGNGSNTVTLGNDSITDTYLKGNVTMTDRLDLSDALDNTFIGEIAGILNTTGGNNLGVGRVSLGSNTTGSFNTAIGTLSLWGNTTGGYNIGVGFESGRFITNGTTANETGSTSIFIGQDTRANADGETNQIVIGDSAIGNGSNTVTLGNDSITNTYLKGNVTMTGRLVLNDALNNTFIGGQSGVSNTTGSYNVASGFNTLYYNTEGNGNIALGFSSLQDNTTGNYNIALGYQSLLENTTGGYNVALGILSLRESNGSFNIALGFKSGRFIADGTTANETGSNSIFIGQDTRANADGEANQIVIGDSAVGNGSNTVTLGNDSIVKTILKGSVGIGTDSPSGRLNVNKEDGTSTVTISRGGADTPAGTTLGNIVFTGDYSASPTTFASIDAYPGLAETRGSLDFKVKSTSGTLLTGMTVYGTSAGANVGIGTTSPGNKLHVENTVSSSWTTRFSNTIANSNNIYFGYNNGTTSYGMYIDGGQGAAGYDINTASGFTVRGDGKVGIGTASPDANLEIDGGNVSTLRISGDGSNSSENKYAAIEFFNKDVSGAGSNIASSIRVLSSSSTGAGGQLLFSTQSGSGSEGSQAVERMRINGQGIVSISNGTPTFVLQNSDNSLIANQIIGDINFSQSDPSGNGVGVVSKIRSINSSSFQGEAGLSFHTGTPTTLAERMRITSGGDVVLNQATSRIYGGGTTAGRLFLGNSDSSSYMIVNGSAHTSPNLVYFVNSSAVTLTLNADNSATFASDVGIGCAPQNEVLTLRRSAGNNLIRLDTSDGTPRSYFGTTNIANGGIAGSAVGDTIVRAQESLIFSAGGSSEKMRITSGGVVEAKAGFSATNGTAFVNVRDNTDGAILSSESNTKSIGLCSGTNYSAGSNFAYLKTTGGAIPLVVVVSNQNGVALTKNSTTWSSVSDETLKENIKPLGNVLDKIKDYQCVEYNLKTDDYEDKKIGFIAQDWENDFAPIISKDEDGILAMKYTETIPVLLKAIQELTAKVERLEAK